VLCWPCWAHILLFRRRLLQFNIFIYGQDVLHIRSTEARFPASGRGHRDRSWQLCRGISFGRKNRVRTDSSRLMGMTVLGLCLAIRTCLSAPCCCCWLRWASSSFFIVPISALIQHQPEEDKKASSSHGELALFCRHRRCFGRVLRRHALRPPQPGRDFLLVGGCDARSNGLCVVAAAGFLAAVDPVDCHEYALPPGCRGARERAGAWRSVADTNHVSMADAVLLIASIGRPIRFLMFKALTSIHW